MLRLRVLVLLLCASGLILQPVLAAAGEMHAWAHDPAGTHAHAFDTGDVGAEPATADQHGGNDAGTLHMLLHFAHCCGMTAAVLLPAGSILAAPATGPLATPATRIPPSALPQVPYRPPILR